MINATLFGEMITFGIFGWFTMRFVMPQVNKALDERENTIADGLRAGEEGKLILDNAKKQEEMILQKAKKDSSVILKDAKAQAAKMIESAVDEALAEKKRRLELAEAEIVQMQHQARNALKGETAALVIAAVEKLLADKVDATCNTAMLEDLLTQVEG